MSVLEAELVTFEKMLPELLKHHRGQFAVIKGDQFIGAFTTQSEAYEAGLKAFGNVPFLIKRVSEEKEDVAMVPAFTLGLLNASQ